MTGTLNYFYLLDSEEEPRFTIARTQGYTSVDFAREKSMAPKVCASHFGIALLVLGAGAISAQAPPQSPPQKVVRDSGAVTATSAALAALGGTPGAICAAGTDSRTQPDGATSNYPIRVCASGASSRVELSLPAGTLVRIVSGGAGEIISPGGKVRILDPQNTAYEVPVYFPGLALADLLADPARSVLDNGTKSAGVRRTTRSTSHPRPGPAARST